MTDTQRLAARGRRLQAEALREAILTLFRPAERAAPTPSPKGLAA